MLYNKREHGKNWVRGTEDLLANLFVLKKLRQTPNIRLFWGKGELVRLHRPLILKDKKVP